MLTVQKPAAATAPGEKPRDGGIPRLEKKNKGFLNVFLEAMDERTKNEVETEYMHDDRRSGIDTRSGTD